jgi:DNA polymerase V
MGIPMGEPWFKVRNHFIDRGGVAFSSNFKLYKLISSRVMRTLEKFSPKLEIYSIDEAFLDFSIKCVSDPLSYASFIREHILSSIGIPVSIGIAPTKTLAKLATAQAKHELVGVKYFSEVSSVEFDRVLENTPIADIWGIGYRAAPKLASWGITNARLFRDKSDAWIQRRMSIRGLKTAWELRGIPCFSLQDKEDLPQSIQISRSFAHPLKTKEDLFDPLAEFVVSAAERLRAHHLKAAGLHLFFNTNRFLPDKWGAHAVADIAPTTDSTPTLIEKTLELLSLRFEDGRPIVRAGIILACTDQREPSNLFEEPLARRQRIKAAHLMKAADKINQTLGKHTLRPAALLTRESKSWLPRCDENFSEYSSLDTIPWVRDVR